MKTKSLLLIFLPLFFISIYSAPLKNVPVTLKQPDGTIIHCFVSGDEYNNWYHDKDNYTIIQNPETGYYVYAIKVGGELQTSEYVVGRSNPKDLGIKAGLNISVKMKYKKRDAIMSLQKRLEGITSAPNTGVINNLVIFIRFSDQDEFNEPLSKYDSMFNDSDVDANSLNNFYYEASYHQLRVVSHFFPHSSTGNVVSYQDAYPRGYHMPYNAVTNPIGFHDFNEGFSREVVMIEAAISAIKDQVPADLAVDGNNDRKIDNLTFIIEGEPAGWGQLLWPHSAGIGGTTIINGATAGPYNIQLQSMIGTGVLAHEMFHSIGAPDLYHYTSNGLRPIGIWDLMASSTNKQRPQFMGAYMKFKYGKWISSISEITTSGTYTLNPITSSTNNVFKIKSPNSSNEYFVLEYRKNIGPFDGVLPGSGLLVYRINNLLEGNGDGPPDEVYIYRPNGTLTVNGDFLTAYFTSDAGRDKIDNITNPSDFLSDGSPGDLNISNIGSAGNTISFNVNLNDQNKDISLLTPNGGETLTTGTTYIKWESIGIGNMKIEYSTDDGNNWNVVESSISTASGQYLWTLPIVHSTNCKIKISDQSDASIFDVSESIFSIFNMKSFTFNYPEKNTYFQAGTEQTIYWQSEGIPSFKLEYSAGDNIWHTLIDSVNAGEGKCTFKTPQIESENVVLKATDRTNNKYYFKSEPFAVKNSGLLGGTYAEDNNTVLLMHCEGDLSNESNNGLKPRPNNGNGNYLENYSLNLGKSYRIDNSEQAGNNCIIIPNSQEINLGGQWTIELWVKIHSLGTHKLELPWLVNKANVFRIYLGNNGNSVVGLVFFNDNTQQQIYWNHPLEINKWYHIALTCDANEKKVRLYIHDENRNLIFNYTRDIPPQCSGILNTSTDDLYIGGVSVNSNVQFDGCVDELRISNIARKFQNLILNSPNGGENLSAGSSFNITWSCQDIQYVKLEYSTNNGSSWNLIANNVNASSESYSWKVPSVNSTNCKLRISDQSDASTFDVSNIPFAISIASSISLVSPNGGESWQSGTVQNITWNSTSITNVKIEFTTDKGNSWNQIVSSTPAQSGKYSWTVPDVNSANCKVRISDQSNASIFDESDSAFTISNPVLTLIAPNGGESWQSGTVQNITWNSTSITNVKIEFTTDKGNSWNQIASSVAAQSGKISWTIPNIVAYECKIKISDAGNAALSDTSDGIFITYSVLPNSVTPLMSIEYAVFTWPLNAYYPETTSSDAENINGRVGNECGPTAMTNVMRYWEFPRKGTGSRTFTDHLGCIWSADFGQTIYNYDLMPESVNKDAPQSEYDAIATLMYHAGAGMHDQLRSGANAGVINAFKQYFNYSHRATFLFRDNYTPEQWDKIFKSELNSGRPIIISGDGGILPDGSHAGHWFICDGYNQNDLFHIKWDLGGGDVYLQLYDFKPYQVRNWALVYLEPDWANKSLSLDYPSGGEYLQRGSTITIRWNSQNINTVLLEYSSNSGETWNTIAQGVSASADSYNWNLPQQASEEYKVRITDENNLNVYQHSKNFMVYGQKSFTFDYPMKNTYFQAGTEQTIYWQSEGVLSFKLEYSAGNNIWHKLFDSVDANIGRCTFQMPQIESENVILKAMDLSDNKSFYTSEPFSIKSSELLGGTYKEDNNTVLLMHFEGDLSNELSNGLIPQGIEANDNFSENYVLNLGKAYRIDNSEQANSNCIRITNSTELNLGGQWSIELWMKILSLGTPKLEFPWVVNKANVFRIDLGHNGDGVNGMVIFNDNTNLQFFHNLPLETNKWYHIALTCDANNKKVWFYVHDENRNLIFKDSRNIPQQCSGILNTSNDDIYIGGVDVNSNIQFDGCVDEIRISNIARKFQKIILNSPNGGENLSAGSSFNITWSCQDIQSIKLEYSTNNGTQWNLIANNVDASSGNYTWSLPSVNSTNCKVRISDQSDASMFDVSDSSFAISPAPELSLTSPNGGELWYSGSKHNITWSSKDIQTIKLEYSINNGTSWYPVKDNISADVEGYEWTIPDFTSANCKIKISDQSDASVFDISDSSFTISPAPELSLTSPNGGEWWYDGSKHDITWNSRNISNINLKFSTNDGSNWIIIEKVYATEDKYTWTIPNVTSQECKISITSSEDSTIMSECEKPFKITPVPSITVKSPNGGEIFRTNSSESITWETEYVDSVKIEQCINGGTSWMTIKDYYPADSNSFNWSVPNTPSKNCLVKITSLSDSAIYDISDNTFTIEVVSSVNNWASGIPDKFELYQNYPNPFNPVSKIRYQVPEQSYVQIILYNILGKEVIRLVDGTRNAGYYELNLNGNNLSSGIYLLKMNAGNYSAIKKIILMK